MRNYFNKQAEQDSVKPILTAAMFFGKTGGFKYAEPKDFVAYGNSLRDEDQSELAAFFSLVKEGLTMVTSRRKLQDRGGLPYKYENFRRSKSTEGAKLILFGNIEQFVKDYQAGKFVTDFELEDLIVEAEK